MASVLHIVSYFPPDRLGGVGEVVSHVHEALQQDGHESTVITTGVTTDDPSVHRIARSPNFFPLATMRHASLARKADVVHLHHGEGAGLLLAMRARRIRTPILLTLHVSVAAMRRSLGAYRIGERSFHHEKPPAWVHRQVTMRVRSELDRVAIALADKLTFISRSAAIDVLGTDAGARAMVIYNGVPAAVPDTESLPPTTDLLFVGTNSERKRVELLPLILSEAIRQRQDTRLRIVGLEKDENPEIVALARELGVMDALEFAGRIPSSSLGRFYRSARVLLVPSIYEGLPMVILEAMQHGLPVVATHVSGHPEVIEHGVTGLLVPVDDPAAMANAALRILGDSSLEAHLGDAGLTVVSSNFSVERQVAAYIAEYKKLVRSRKRTS